MSQKSRRFLMILIACLFIIEGLNDTVPVKANLTSNPEPDDLIPGVVGLVYTTALDDDYIYLGGKFSSLYYDVITSQDSALLDVETGRVDQLVHLSNGETQIYDVIPDGSGGWYVAGSIGSDGFAHVLPDGTNDPAWDPQYACVSCKLVVAGEYLYAGSAYGIQRINLETGVLDASWKVKLPSYPVIYDMTLSSDGKSIFYIRDFNSSYPYGLLKVDIASAAVVNGWEPTLSARYGISNSVASLAIMDGMIYIGGSFIGVDGQVVDGLAVVDEDSGELVQSFHPITIEYFINALTADNQGHLYVAYTVPNNGEIFHYIRRFHVKDWSSDHWVPSINEKVSAMSFFEGALYVISENSGYSDRPISYDAF